MRCQRIASTSSACRELGAALSVVLTQVVWPGLRTGVAGFDLCMFEAMSIHARCVRVTMPPRAPLRWSASRRTSG